MIIVERDRRCRNLPELVHCRYSISEGQKIMDIGNAIKKRMIAIDKKYENESLVLSLDHTIPSKGTPGLTQTGESRTSTRPTKTQKMASSTSSIPTWTPSDISLLMITPFLPLSLYNTT